MDKQKDLWTEVGNKCLRRASELLDSETTPTAATAEVVKSLVETAISMDLLNLRWAIQNRSGAATRRAGTAVVSSEADIKAAAAAIHGNIGLRAHAVVTDSEVIAAAEQKELRGWSFGFVKQKDHWKTDEEGTRRRFVDELELREVSILDKTPAYIATSIETRDDDEILVEFRADQPLEDGVDYIRQTESATETKTTTLTPGDESVMFCAQKTVEIYKMRRRM